MNYFIPDLVSKVTTKIAVILELVSGDLTRFVFPAELATFVGSSGESIGAPLPITSSLTRISVSEFAAMVARNEERKDLSPSVIHE